MICHYTVHIKYNLLLLEVLLMKLQYLLMNVYRSRINSKEVKQINSIDEAEVVLGKVNEYIPPETFEKYGEAARGLGFLQVASAPFVRSSYQAEEQFSKINLNVIEKQLI